MPYLSHERIIATGAVKNDTAFNIPDIATHVELQALVQPVNYTMDGSSNPNATTDGMSLLITEPPKLFLIQDLKNIRFTRGAGSDGNLNLHYIGGP